MTGRRPTGGVATALRVVTIVFGWASGPVAASAQESADVARWHPIVEAASVRFGVPPGWIEQVIWAESRGRTEIDGRPIRSVKGAIGLMQLMPGTWAKMRDQLGLGSDPDRPFDNIMAGTYYLRLLYDRFGYPGLFAAYNAGPGRYEKYLAGTPLPSETRAYLARVTARASPSLLSPAVPGTRDLAQSGLFVGRSPTSSTRVDAEANTGAESAGRLARVADGAAPDGQVSAGVLPRVRPPDRLFVVRTGGPDAAP